jgi:hypothetical protein
MTEMHAPDLVSSSKFCRGVELFVKYARVKRGLFRSKAWVPKRVFDALVVAFPSANEIEKRLLGKVVDKLIASAIPRPDRGGTAGFLVSYKYLVELEAILRKDGLHWRVGFYTTGSLPGGDYWGID